MVFAVPGDGYVPPNALLAARLLFRGLPASHFENRIRCPYARRGMVFYAKSCQPTSAAAEIIKKAPYHDKKISWFDCFLKRTVDVLR